MSIGPLHSQTRSGSFSIADLVQFAGSGIIRVPSFQRSFVWDAADVRQLFDSLYRGFPVGTVLLWQHEGPAGEIQFGPISLNVEARSDALWVIDGQQRITSLFGSLHPRYRGYDDRFEVYFDLAGKRFVHARRGVPPNRSIPVREALETRQLLNWLRIHADDLSVEDYDLADRLGGVFREFKIPAYIVTGDDQILLREIFDRINSAGKPIRRAQVFHALFAREEVPGSPATVAKGLEQIGFGTIDGNRIVQSLLAIRGGDVQRDIHEEFAKDEDLADWYDRTEVALSRTIEFLRSEGVYHILLMPNTLPIPVLAAFFYLHPDPAPWIRRLLSRWLWRGWVHAFGREGGQTPTMRKSIRSINPIKGDPSGAPPEYEAIRSLLAQVPDRDSPDIPLSPFMTDKVNARLILLAMASLEPKGPGGQALDLAKSFDLRGIRAVTEFVKRHRSHAAARGFWPSDPKEILGEPPSTLLSHAIDEQAASSLNAGNPVGFIEARSKLLGRHVADFLANKLEVNSIVRPSLDELVSIGNAEDE